MTTIYLGIGISVIGLIWTIYGVMSNRKLKNLIISEKNMILDKILDTQQSLRGHYMKIINDRKIKKDETLDMVCIRIEDIESILANLNRFARRLENLK